MSSPKLLHHHHHHHHHHDQVLCGSRVPSSSYLTARNPNPTSCRPARAPALNNHQSCRPIRSCSSSSTPSLAVAAPRCRPVVILPGLGNNSNDYIELISSLKEKGLAATVAHVSRPDWLRNALGLLDRNYWAGKLSPRPVLDWYFERMNKAITAAKETAEGDMKVSLVGHSAGGWLARVYMSEFGIDDIAMLLSLGTPHLPPPKGVPGVVDQTRGLLNYVNEVCPGTCFAPDVKYICVAGRFLEGERLFPAEVPVVATTGVGTIVAADKQQVSTVSETRSLEDDGKAKERVATFQARIVGQGYKQLFTTTRSKSLDSQCCWYSWYSGRYNKYSSGTTATSNCRSVGKQMYGVMEWYLKCQLI